MPVVFEPIPSGADRPPPGKGPGQGRGTPTGEAPPRTVTLPDGRRLAYSELGDPAGEPVLYCHGFPCSRREAELLDPVARIEGVRVISPDRPGYGGSDPAPGRRLADWAEDCAVLAERLRIARLRLIGVSGGAPYALACAARSPARIAACALVCPLGPLYLEPLLRRMSPLVQAGFRLARSAPALAAPVLKSPLPAWIGELPGALDGLRARGCAPADRAVLAEPGNRAVLNGAIRDALRGRAVGARQDLRLYTEPWGFDLAALATPFAVWHGDADRIVPPEHGRWYAEHLPKARLHLLPGEGHYSLPLGHAGPILKGLLALG